MELTNEEWRQMMAAKCLKEARAPQPMKDKEALRAEAIGWASA